MSPGRQKVKIALEEKLIHLENDAYSAFSSALKVFFKWTCTTQKRKYLDKTIKNFFNKELTKEIMKNLNWKIDLLKTKMKKIGANIKFNVTTVSNSYIKQKSNIIRI